jgi:hypothetical protein
MGTLRVSKGASPTFLSNYVVMDTANNAGDFVGHVMITGGPYTSRLTLAAECKLVHLDQWRLFAMRCYHCAASVAAGTDDLIIHAS